jgi:hypothetical protein
LIVAVTAVAAPQVVGKTVGLGPNRAKSIVPTANQKTRQALKKAKTLARQPAKGEAKPDRKGAAAIAAWPRSLAPVKPSKQRIGSRSVAEQTRLLSQRQTLTGRLRPTGGGKQERHSGKRKKPADARKAMPPPKTFGVQGVQTATGIGRAPRAGQSWQKPGANVSVKVAPVAGVKVDTGVSIDRGLSSGGLTGGSRYARELEGLIEALIDAQGTEWWTRCLTGAGGGGQDAIAALQGCARRAQKGSGLSIGGSQRGAGFGGPAGDGDCKGGPGRLGPRPRGAYDGEPTDWNGDGDNADERAREHVQEARGNRQTAEFMRTMANENYFDLHVRRLATKAAKAFEAAADAHDEAADAADDLDRELDESRRNDGDPVDAGESDRATRHAEEASAYAAKHLERFDNAVMLRPGGAGASQPGGVLPDERPPGTWESARCSRLKSDSTVGILFMNKDFCRGDNMMSCLRRVHDTLYAVTDGRCGVEAGTAGGRTIRCNNDGESAPGANGCPANNPGCLNDGVGNGSRPGSRGRSGGASGSVPWGYLETTPIGQSVTQMCANGRPCGETW